MTDYTHESLLTPHVDHPSAHYQCSLLLAVIYLHKKQQLDREREREREKRAGVSEITMMSSHQTELSVDTPSSAVKSVYATRPLNLQCVVYEHEKPPQSQSHTNTLTEPQIKTVWVQRLNTCIIYTISIFVA